MAVIAKCCYFTSTAFSLKRLSWILSLSSAKSSFFPFWNSFSLVRHLPSSFFPTCPPCLEEQRTRERERERAEERRVATEREERRPPKKRRGPPHFEALKDPEAPGVQQGRRGLRGLGVGRSVGRSGLARKRRPRTLVRRGTPTQASAKEARQ